MKEKDGKIDRRNFLKAAGAAGLGSVIAASQLKGGASESQKAEKPEYPELPKRKLGKTGIEIPVLSSGLNFDVTQNQWILKANEMYNVTCWATAYNYAGGNSETGIGRYLKKNPELRKKLFIISSGDMNLSTTEAVEGCLQSSLNRLNTDYIDFYWGVHGCEDPDTQLTGELQKWAEDAKKRKLIRYFGFSTHKNMEKCLMAASKMDWIDAIMTTYNVTLMQNPQMQEAVQACYDAGIGLIAIKTLLGVQKKQAAAEDKMVSHFLDKGYTRSQALIKAVLEDKRITTACVNMENNAYLRLNTAAVLDTSKLTQADTNVLRKYAAESCSGYCAGCAYICDAALPEVPYTSDIMRYLMYYNSYGNHQEARELFAQIPGDVRSRLLSTDYGPAEARCPQHLPIGKLVAEAVCKLA